MLKIILMLSVMFINAHAQEIEVDYLREMDDTSYRLSNFRLYRAEGEHQCQSSRAIGHSCKTLGVNFTDCQQAFYKLKSDDCCSGSEYGGNSIKFKITKCTYFN